MGLFKEYLKESEELLSKINDIVSSMDADEVDEFGFYIFSEFFEDKDEEHDDDAAGRDDAREDEGMYFSAQDVMDMVIELGSEYYEDILDMLDYEDDEDEDEEYEEDGEVQDEMDEAVGRRFLSKNRNKNKRKFMANSKASLRKTATKRKRAARQNKSARKRYYKANKQKIAAYQKSRAAAIKSGKHVVKKRRQA